MRYKKGDKVKFLNDTGGGIVTNIIDKNTLHVLIDEGFELPVNINDVLPVDVQESGQPADEFPEEKEDRESRNQNEDFDTLEEILSEHKYEFQDEDPETIKNDETVQLLLAFVPTNQETLTEGTLYLYIINDSNYKILYNISMKEPDKNNEFITVHSGFTEANTKNYIQEFEREDLNRKPDILFQCIFFKKNMFSFHAPIVSQINVQPIKLYHDHAYKENDFFDEKAYVLPVEIIDLKEEVDKIPPEEIKKILQEKSKPKKIKIPEIKPTGKRREKQKPREIDLHIHELVDDESGLTDADKLELQMLHFRKKINEAIQNHEKRIIFIHGVGNGRLKHEIRNAIDKEYPGVEYQDASFQEYGFGATLIFIK